MQSQESRQQKSPQTSQEPQSQVTPEELAELAELDIMAGSGVNEEVGHRIVKALIDPEVVPMLSELSNDQVKLLTRIRGIGKAFNDHHKLDVYDTFLTLMVSKERQGRTALEKIATPVLPPGMQGNPSLKDKIYSVFGKKRSV